MIAKAISRAWVDASYKAKLMSDPHAALAEMGVEVPDGVAVKVVENTADIQHLVLPVAPDNAKELSLDQVNRLAAGTTTMKTPGVY